MEIWMLEGAEKDLKQGWRTNAGLVSQSFRPVTFQDAGQINQERCTIITFGSRLVNRHNSVPVSFHSYAKG